MYANRIFLSSLFLCIVSLLISCQSNSNVNSDKDSPSESGFHLPEPPAVLTDPQDKLNYVFEHYWDHFNFSDTSAQFNNGSAEQILVDYLAMFPQVSLDKLETGIPQFLDQAKIEPTSFAFFQQKLDSYLYDPNSPMRNDLYYEPVLTYFTASDRISAADKEKYKVLLDLVKRNKEGTRATDFSFLLADGTTSSLYQTDAALLLLMFYEPGCSNCEETFAALKAHAGIQDLISNKHLSVLAVYPDGNLDIWKNYRSQVPANFINVIDEKQAVLSKGLYDLKASPTIYLLDKDKKVILKDTDLNGFGEYLSTVSF